MNSAEIRQHFLHFFKERDHRVLPSSSLIPFNDPTVLLTTAGMLQFKPYFLGQASAPYPRVATVQKVFRTSDIEVVGHDGHHLTFFEMLGNFSFGDYFKEKAIPYAYELLTTVFGLEPPRLWAGIHHEDDESFEIWKATGIPAERIRRFGDEYNFWAAGPTGPCGPDSEVHYDTGEGPFAHPDCGPNCERDDRFLEIWNLVFMQWDRDASGKRTPLRKNGIDTGMGLERLTAVVNRQRGVFDTDLFQPLIDHWEKATAQPYGTQPEVDVSLRALADHSRGSAMLLADDVIPSNEGRGYVLRRLIRRAMVHLHRISHPPRPSLASAVPRVAEILGDAYPDVRHHITRIEASLRSEEERFSIPLRLGMERLEASLRGGSVSPEEAFYLHDTMGFPIELTRELAVERGFPLDTARVEALMQGQRDRSRSGAPGFVAPMAKSATRFVGYERLEADTTVVDVFPVEEDPNAADVFLDETPFYAERGGQAPDDGILAWDGHTAKVTDAQWAGEAVRHRVNIAPAALSPGQRVRASVRKLRRLAIARHHSATHLLHKAVRQTLGEQATQAGSQVLPDYATFDFQFHRALTYDETQAIQRLLNEKIRENLPRRVEEMPLKEAIATGAVALFDEKYGETVRVVSFGDWARELCGGTHVERTGEIGLALINSERSIASGVRRIEMRAGRAALEQVLEHEDILQRLAEALKGAAQELPEKVRIIQSQAKQLEKEVVQLRQRLAAGGSARVEEGEVDGIRFMLQRVDPQERDLMVYADHLVNRTNGHGVAVIVGGRNFTIKVGARLAEWLSANDLVDPFIRAAGGRGGGRGPVAQGGGIEPERVSDAFRSMQAYVRQRMGQR